MERRKRGVDARPNGSRLSRRVITSPEVVEELWTRLDSMLLIIE